jgi:hypothetical protein
MRFSLAAGIAIALLASTASAQPAGPDTTAQQAALAPIQWIVGAWEGHGWVDTPTARQTFRQTELVESRLGGLVVTMEGRGYSGAPETLQFNAFGVLSHNDKARRTVFNSWTRGYATEAAAEVRPDETLVWTMTPPGQVIRYTITQPRPGRWREVGERSTDNGATFTQFFEMELAKK